MVAMISCSAAWSTSVTKSLRPLEVTVRDSRRFRLRTMISPARRAARTAMLRSGGTVLKLVCPMGVDVSVADGFSRHSHGAGGALASRQHRRGRARHEEHGAQHPGAGGAEAVPAPGGQRTRLGR